MKRFKNNQRGFTLVELIVVLVILALLAALLIPSLSGYINKAGSSAAIVECRSSVMAAQTLSSSHYAKGTLSGWLTDGSVTDTAEIESLGEVPGAVNQCRVDPTTGKVSYLEYQTGDVIVIYENGAYRLDDGSGAPVTGGPVTATVEGDKITFTNVQSAAASFMDAVFVLSEGDLNFNTKGVSQLSDKTKNSLLTDALQYVSQSENGYTINSGATKVYRVNEKQAVSFSLKAVSKSRAFLLVDGKLYVQEGNSVNNDDVLEFLQTGSLPSGWSEYTGS